jgi:DNA-binding transcriptional LysR family regulator
VTLGTSHHVGLHRLPPILREINRRFPEVALDLRFMESEAALEAVEGGELDLAVVTLPVNKPASLETRVIWVDPMLAVAAPEHPLAGMASLAPESLSEFPAVLPHTGSHTRELIDRALQSLGIRPPVPFCTNFLETNRMMVAVGLAWSVLPRTMINSQIRPLPVEDLHVTRHLGMIRHRRREQGGAAGAVLKLLAGYSDPASFRDQS